MSSESQQDQQKKKMGRPRKYDEDFPQTALERMKACQDMSALTLELGVNRAQLYRFRNEALDRKPEPRSEAWRKENADERQRRRVAELERLVARQALELDFFKAPCCASRKIAGSGDRIPASRLRANPAR